MAPAIAIDEKDAQQLSAVRGSVFHQPKSQLHTVEGWPTVLHSDLSWDGSQIQNELEYTHLLNQTEKAEIRNALRHFKGIV